MSCRFGFTRESPLGKVGGTASGRPIWKGGNTYPSLIRCTPFTGSDPFHRLDGMYQFKFKETYRKLLQAERVESGAGRRFSWSGEHVGVWRPSESRKHVRPELTLQDRGAEGCMWTLWKWITNTKSSRWWRKSSNLHWYLFLNSPRSPSDWIPAYRQVKIQRNGDIWSHRSRYFTLIIVNWKFQQFLLLHFTSQIIDLGSLVSLSHWWKYKEL